MTTEFNLQEEIDLIEAAGGGPQMYMTHANAHGMAAQKYAAKVKMLPKDPQAKLMRKMGKLHQSAADALSAIANGHIGHQYTQQTKAKAVMAEDIAQGADGETEDDVNDAHNATMGGGAGDDEDEGEEARKNADQEAMPHDQAAFGESMTQDEHDRKREAENAKKGWHKDAGKITIKWKPGQKEAAEKMKANLKEDDVINESHEAHELQLHGDNDSHLYHSSKVPVMKNLEKKFKKGTYDHEKSKTLWKYHADRAAQSYHKEYGGEDMHGNKHSHWSKQFTPAHRKEAASSWADAHHAEMKAGNFHESVEVEGEVIQELLGHVIDGQPIQFGSRLNEIFQDLASAKLDLMRFELAETFDGGGPGAPTDDEDNQDKDDSDEGGDYGEDDGGDGKGDGADKKDMPKGTKVDEAEGGYGHLKPLTPDSVRKDIIAKGDNRSFSAPKLGDKIKAKLKEARLKEAVVGGVGKIVKGDKAANVSDPSNKSGVKIGGDSTGKKKSNTKSVSKAAGDTFRTQDAAD